MAVGGSSWGTSPDGECCLPVMKALLTWPLSRVGTWSYGPPAGLYNHLPSICWLPAVATAVAKANTTAAAQPGVCHDVMSSAALPPFWASRAVQVLYLSFYFYT